MVDPSTALELIVEDGLKYYAGVLLGSGGGSWNATVQDDILRIWGACHDDMGHVVHRFDYCWGLVDLNDIPTQRGASKIVVLNVPPR